MLNNRAPNLQNLFVPAYITFTNKPAVAQAQEILALVDHYHRQGYTHIGMTYSANHGQVEKQILPAYANNQWQTGVRGGNQASVMNAVENLLAQPPYSYLQGIFRIMPITTCELPGGAGAVRDEWLQDDLVRISQFLEQPNHVVLGWQNEATGNQAYAIGGAISQALTIQQNKLIQNHLKFLALQYAGMAPIQQQESAPHCSSLLKRK